MISDNSGNCCGGNPSCNVSQSIYTGKTDTGKGDSPRKVTKQYEKNYSDIFPNAFKPKWQKELENENVSKTKKLN
tara:strand:- start:2073 stop:2297 length:225 start_codon:yes stop_codon:yes gene_type:complete